MPVAAVGPSFFNVGRDSRSTYCEMGIDVRSYAQRGANVVRASCVGCGICSAVCARGVLNLENGETHKDRIPGADKPLEELKRSLRRR